MAPRSSGSSSLDTLSQAEFQSPKMKRSYFGGIRSRRYWRSSHNCSPSTSLASVVEALTWITVVLNALECLGNGLRSFRIF